MSVNLSLYQNPHYCSVTVTTNLIRRDTFTNSSCTVQLTAKKDVIYNLNNLPKSLFSECDILFSILRNSMNNLN